MTGAYETQVQEFANQVEAQVIADLTRRGLSSQIEANRVNVGFGRKYARVDVGDSGRYMVDREGNVFCIKAYGVVDRSRQIGTLEDNKINRAR